MIKITEIENIVDRLSVDESTNPLHVKGSRFQRERIKEICEITLNNYSGDILEIGCHIGTTTVILCKIAQAYNRRVICIDPWDGKQQGNQKVYDEFMINTSMFSDVLDLKRVSSQHEDAIELISTRDICFSFVDGLHTSEACGVDIDSCSKNTGVMCVDDIGWIGDLKLTFDHKCTEHGFESYHNSNCREGYYIVT